MIFYNISGKTPNSKRRKKFEQLSNYKEGKFQNIVPTQVMNSSFFEILKENFKKPKTISPSKPIPSIKTDLHKLKDEIPTIVWFGHSSYLIKFRGINILVDPVFCGYAAPFSFMVNAFEGANTYQVEDLPVIDFLIITHDHYDHLDYQTIKKLKEKVKKIITPLGVGSHLEFWGVNSANITELNWNENTQLTNEIHLTATPARHMSGRSISMYNTLWTSYSLKLYDYKIFIGGDSGYGTHFKTIGEEHGPFDLAFLENGQYDKNWQAIHLFPEEVVQAAQELKVKTLFPVHWSKFVLANHAWNAPIKRLLTAADKSNLKVTVPQIGEPYQIGDSVKREEWWVFE